MQSPWRPASAEESFEIVRRRLFQPVSGGAAHAGLDAVARAFSQMYGGQPQEFPAECREGECERRMKRAYPIHPELFDRLYNTWSTLDRFQRTRGVLRLMAKVIYSLWSRDDRSLLIMPSSVPIDDLEVSGELTKFLEEHWVPIIEQDVDGEKSLPRRLERENPNLARYSAVRRVPSCCCFKTKLPAGGLFLEEGPVPSLCSFGRQPGNTASSLQAKVGSTKFWINNPSREEAKLAIAEGALGCTNNPSYCHKMLEHPSERETAMTHLRDAVARSKDDDEAAAIFQRNLVKPIQEIFYPTWKDSRGADGYVSIQGDPVHEHDPNVIIREARENGTLGENIAIKIPCTRAGLEAMQVLVEEGYPINATEIMSISQGISLCEMYEKITGKTAKKPRLWLSFIAGIYDEYLENYVRDNRVDIPLDIVHQAGLAATRKMYQIIHDRRYQAIIIGGGARDLRHFTEMVGGDQVVTINWKGTADCLLEQSPDVVHRFQCPVPPMVIDELLSKLPDFRRGWHATGLSVDEYEGFGPVELFRSMFLKSWNAVLGMIRDLRE